MIRVSRSYQMSAPATVLESSEVHSTEVISSPFNGKTTSCLASTHLKDVDVDVGHREHGPAHQHAEQSAEERLEA